MKIEDVTLWTCDHADGHKYEWEQEAGYATTESGDDVPAGWIEVYGVAERALTFCSVLCGYRHLMDVHSAREATEAGEAA